MPATTARARALRRTAPFTERFLWKLLRDRRLEGLKFRRQVPLGPYVADFVCFGARLVIETDGPFHDPDHDRARDAWLAAQGFRTLRFSNDQVLGPGWEVLAAIRAAADPSSGPRRGPPSPARGEGPL